MATVIESIREIVGGAPDALRELEGLHAAGKLTTANVLEIARDPRSPLHKHFEWDDALAAESYRLDQARALVQSYRLHIVDTGGERNMRYYTNVIVRDEHAYRHTEEVIRVDTLRDQHRLRVIRELNRLRGELATFDTFSAALTGIDAALTALESQQ